MVELEGLEGRVDSLSVKGSRIALKSPPAIKWVADKSGIRLKTLLKNPESSKLGAYMFKKVTCLDKMWHVTIR